MTKHTLWPHLLVFIFLVPLLPIRKRIRERKLQELALIQQQLNKLTSGKSNLADSVSL